LPGSYTKSAPSITSGHFPPISWKAEEPALVRDRFEIGAFSVGRQKSLHL